MGENVIGRPKTTGLLQNVCISYLSVPRSTIDQSAKISSFFKSPTNASEGAGTTLEPSSTSAFLFSVKM